MTPATPTAPDRSATADPSPRHLPALDGLRGLAALSVVLGHMPNFGFAQWVGLGAQDFGVALFFSLSGFLMGHLYLRRGWTTATAWSFAVARIARIVPIYFLVVLTSFIIYHTIDHHFIYDVSTRQLVRLLTFNGSVSVFWSVGPEFQFYAIFIGLWWMWDRPALRLWSIVAAVGMSAFAIIWNARVPGILFVSKAHIFMFGVAASIVLRTLWAHRAHSWVRPSLQMLAIASLLVIAVPNSYGAHLHHILTPISDNRLATFYGNPLLAPWAALVVLALAWEGRIVDCLLANRVLVWLGEISFSLYLLHAATLWILSKAGLILWVGNVAASSAVVVLSVLVAWASRRLIEAPCQRAVRRRLAFGVHHPQSVRFAEAAVRVRPS